MCGDFLLSDRVEWHSHALLECDIKIGSIDVLLTIAKNAQFLWELLCLRIAEARLRLISVNANSSSNMHN